MVATVATSMVAAVVDDSTAVDLMAPALVAVWAVFGLGHGS